MRIIFILSFYLLFLSNAFSQGGHKIDAFVSIPYTKYAPVATKAPSVGQSNLLYNSVSGILYKWNKSSAHWEDYNSQDYAELGISNDTLSISFAGTTPDTLLGMTSTNLQGFTLSSDGGVLTYTGDRTKTFLLSYSTSFTFAEASVMFAYIVKNGAIIYPTRTRNLGATAGNMVNSAGNAIFSISPGQTLSLFFVPGTHTGTDALTVYETNIIISELK